MKTILGISFVLYQVLLAGVLGFNLSPDRRATVPVILEKNCSHVTYSFDVQHEPPNTGGVFYMYESETDYVRFGETQVSELFLLAKIEGNKFFDYISLRADPIPNTADERHTIYITFRFPDKGNEYRLSLAFFTTGQTEIKSPLKVGKSRCVSEDDITGCDPYCVCDTVVQKKCQGSSSIRGKCSDSGSRTDNSASYIFDGTCATATSTGTSSSKTPSLTKTSAASQSLASTIGIVIGLIITVAVIVAFFFYRKKKEEVTKGGYDPAASEASSVSDLQDQ